MKSDEWLDKLMPEIAAGLRKCWRCPMSVNAEKGFNLAGKKAVEAVLDELIAVMFPGCHGHAAAGDSEFNGTLQAKLRDAAIALKNQVSHAFRYQCEVDECDDCEDCDTRAEACVSQILKDLPLLQSTIRDDIEAAYEGDPAARSTMEVVMSYPGLYAVIVHRIAHVLQEREVPLIPRIMSEYAHSQTGIDIHPGARIGRGFFIDHGTGVVIGETCVIGDHVKLYQGVTLGAVSFEKDEDGNLVKGIKRHPDVGDNVVIYAGATILGGRTTIGESSEIGGNVWLTHSVPPGSKVYNQQPRPLIREADGSWKTAEGPWSDVGGGI